MDVIRLSDSEWLLMNALWDHSPRTITQLVETGCLTLSQLIEKMSVNPAKILKIPAGVLEEDGCADIVLFDPKEQWVVDENALHGKSKNTPFKGMTLTGKVKITICGGKVVYEG